MLLIPAIDLRNGRCVRLFKGDFNAETRYEYDPLDLHERYRGFGATWLHVVDLDGAKDGVLANRPTIVRLAAQRSLRIQLGGGMRSAAVIEDVLGARCGTRGRRQRRHRERRLRWPDGSAASAPIASASRST